ncbi:MAG: MtrB/PioB family decaheme-associated outer membrane protein [Xanthobacteraceae bacterium]
MSTDALAQTTAYPPPVSTGAITLGPSPRPTLDTIGAQVPGCCEGGSATGANAWTTGNATATDWPTTSVGSVPYWWTHGEIEAGGRDFVNNPSRDGAAHLGQQSLAKYYEYSTIAPGPFGGGHIATGSRDGLYQADLWANNVGYGDQSYLLNASKVGEQYFTAIWDQTPHLYGTSGQTFYNGVGTNNLTLPPGLVGAPLPTASAAGIAPYLHQTDIGIYRDTAAASYRWTPTTAWDFGADYSHMDRKGTQAEGIVEFDGFMPAQVPAPVNDTTQNFGASGEYAGISPWGKRFTVKAGYNGSVYTDNVSSYTAQNPFFPTVASCKAPTASGSAAGTANCGSAQMSTPPSNDANGVSGTLAADLPLQSRYVGTMSYTMMRQNATFLPMTNNPLAVASPFGPNWNAVNFGFVNGNLGDPTNGLDGQINTLLSNNVLTSKITPDLTQKMSYRYYGFDNDTPRIIFPCWISYDGTGATITPGNNPCGGNSKTGTGFEDTISSLSLGYVKQDAGYELNWRPSKEWNFNAAYGFERYNYTETDANVTNENSGKLSVDWKPTSWITARASGYFADRRYDTYDYDAFVKAIQFPTVAPFTPNTNSSWFYAPAYQQFMFDNRQRTKVNLYLDVVAFRGVTITPSFKYQDDNYGLNPLNQEGINDSRSTSWGVDVAYVVTPRLSLAVSYYWEYYNQSLYNYTNTYAGGGYEAEPGTCQAAPAGNANANCLLTTSDKERVNTIMAVVNYEAIPGRLDLDLRYSISDGIDQMLLLTNPAMPAAACSSCVGVFPNDTTLFQRLDATATYKFDPTLVHQMGWMGDVRAKLRYTWERSSVSNWQNDPLAPFTPSVSATAIWLAYDNPNYNVQMLSASLIARW